MRKSVITLCLLFPVCNCFPEGHSGDERVIQSCEQKVLYWICKGKGE